MAFLWTIIGHMSAKPAIKLHITITPEQDRILDLLKGTSLKSKAALIREGINMLIKWQYLEETKNGNI